MSFHGLYLFDRSLHLIISYLNERKYFNFNAYLHRGKHFFLDGAMHTLDMKKKNSEKGKEEGGGGVLLLFFYILYVWLSFSRGLFLQWCTRMYRRRERDTYTGENVEIEEKGRVYKRVHIFPILKHCKSCQCVILNLTLSPPNINSAWHATC